MGEDQDEHRGHPVTAGLLTAAAFVTARYLAREYLVRVSGEAAAGAFSRRMRRNTWAGIISCVTLLITACLVSYASLPAAYGIALAAATAGLILAGGPLLMMSAYASRQAQHLAQYRGYLGK